MIDWEAIFTKRFHEFTEDEIYAAGIIGEGPLATSCPEFWETFKPLERNSNKMTAIFELDVEFAEAVQKGLFHKAKRLYHELLKVKI